MKTVIKPQMGLTFEDVWASLMELREEMRISHEKTDAQLRETSEQMKKTDEQMKKTDEQMKKTDEQMKKTDERINKLAKNVGGLNGSLGELIETLIAAKLWEKFDAYPYKLKRAYQRVPIFDESNRILTDIDILLTNDEYIMAVEVKASLHRKDDVDRHIKRMEQILMYPSAECKGKKLLGAMAGGTVNPEIRDYAHSAGFFVLELAGESVRLIPPPKDFTPRLW